MIEDGTHFLTEQLLKLGMFIIESNLGDHLRLLRN